MQNYLQHVESVRQKFQEIFKDNLQKETYDKRDLERIRLEDDYICCFLTHQHGSIEKAALMIDTSLRWRKELGLNDLTEQTFPRKLHENGEIFYHNNDKDGHPILHIVVSKHRKNLESSLCLKQFLAWYIDKEFLKHPGQRIVVLIDMTSAGLANVDIDLIKFQVSCFTTYYPATLAYMLIFEMPWVLNAIWNIIKKLLNAEQQKYVLLVKRHQMLQYIDREQLFVHMGGTDTYKYVYLPSEDSGIEVMNRESDCESLVSSYEQTVASPATLLRKRVTFGGFSSSLDCVDYEEKTSSVAMPSVSGDNNVYHGSLVDISPSERLTFVTDNSGRGDFVSHISISNTSKLRLSFKVKTTSPDVYRVKPHSGILTNKDQAVITITLPNGHNCSDHKDKFLVMILALKDDVGEDNHAQLNSLWKKLPKNPEEYMEHRLVCEKIQSESVVNCRPVSIKHLPSLGGSVEETVKNLVIVQQQVTDQLQKIIQLLTVLLALLVVLLIAMLFKIF